MKNLLLRLTITATLIFSTGIAHAVDASFMGGTSAVIGSYMVFRATTGDALSSEIDNSSTSGDIRLKVINAKEDAATFLASEGNIRGAAFISALKAIREANPNLVISDMELAEQILEVE